MHIAQMKRAARKLWQELNPVNFQGRENAYCVKVHKGVPSIIVFSFADSLDRGWELLRLNRQILRNKMILWKLAASLKYDKFVVIFPVEWQPGKWVACSLKLDRKAMDRHTLEIYDPASIIVFQNKRELHTIRNKLKSLDKDDTIDCRRNSNSTLLQLNSAPLVLDCINDLLRTGTYDCSIRNIDEALPALQGAISRLHSLLGDAVGPIQIILDPAIAKYVEKPSVEESSSVETVKVALAQAVAVPDNMPKPQSPKFPECVSSNKQHDKFYVEPLPEQTAKLSTPPSIQFTPLYASLPGTPNIWEYNAVDELIRKNVIRVRNNGV